MLKNTIRIVAAVLVLQWAALAQSQPVPSPTLTPQQLDDLVAPIALYPDPLVGEVLAASTYPMEIAEAQQWVLDHPKWKPSKLMDEAKKQNLTFVGHVPDAPLIEWPRDGERPALQAFVNAVRARFDPAERLLLICRSGVRSHYAAELLARMGYPNAYNVLEGFEGEHGAGANGWRAAGLPWKKG